ncbi:MAG: VOC family protein [Chloroflexi bacterium]|nr:VOC family protein [Chloroflexota bacterium]
MSRVTHFEIPAKDPNKVAAFYKEVFGWQSNKWEGPVDYWLVMTGPNEVPGINGGFYTPDGGPMSGVINTIEVDDLDAHISKIKANGGIVVVDKMAVPGVGWMIYFKDVEGSLWGLMQLDGSAGIPPQE